jgi:hypothetical protein
VSRINPADIDFEEWARRAFSRWQLREGEKDEHDRLNHNRYIIENGDPETESAITALEEGWRKAR